MFVSLPKALSIFGSVLGIGGIGTVGAYATTKKTISDSLGEVRIVDKDKGGDEVWGKLKKKLDESKEEGKQKPKSKVFVDLQNEKPKGELKNVCQGVGNNIYWTIFSKDSDLMDDVKNFCSITIEETFTETLLSVEKIDEDNNDKTGYENKMNELKQHKTKKPGQNLNKELNDIYEKVKANGVTPKDHWLDLVKWCSKSYKSYFFNKDDDLWKNTETYCKK